MFNSLVHRCSACPADTRYALTVVLGKTGMTAIGTKQYHMTPEDMEYMCGAKQDAWVDAESPGQACDYCGEEFTDLVRRLGRNVLQAKGNLV